MLNALQQNAGPIITFTVATAYLIGISFIISAVMNLKKIGQSSYMQSQAGSISGPLIKFVVGLLLMYLPSTIDVGVVTLWGQSAFSEEYMSYTPNVTDPFAPAKAGAIAVIRVVGYISFVRGFIILARSGDQGAQQGTFGKGLLHVIGGMLAINVVATIRVIGNTLGITTV